MEFRYLRGVTAPGIARAAAYDISGVVPGTHLAVPSPALTMIIDLGHGLDLTGPGLPRRTTFRVCLSGMHLEPYLIHHDGLQRGVQVDVRPSFVRALTGAPAAELGGGVVELDSLDAGLARELYDSVATAAAPQREAAAARVLARHADSERAVQPDAAWAWSYLAAHRGNVTVAELVERSGWSARYLAMKFTAEFGMSIKQAARLMRFHAARHALEAGDPAVAVAADTGYADQAHLSREVRAFVGSSPSAYLARRRGEFRPL